MSRVVVRSRFLFAGAGFRRSHPSTSHHRNAGFAGDLCPRYAQAWGTLLTLPELLEFLAARFLYELAQVRWYEVQIALGDLDGAVPHCLSHQVDRFALRQPSGHTGVSEVMLAQIGGEPRTLRSFVEGAPEALDPLACLAPAGPLVVEQPLRPPLLNTWRAGRWPRGRAGPPEAVG